MEREWERERDRQTDRDRQRGGRWCQLDMIHHKINIQH